MIMLRLTAMYSVTNIHNLGKLRPIQEKYTIDHNPNMLGLKLKM